MFRILTLILTLFWGQGKVFAQPQNPKHWLIADSNTIQFSDSIKIVKQNFVIASQMPLPHSAEVSAAVLINNSLIVGNSFQIAIIDSELNKKYIIEDFRIKFGSADKSTFTITQGLLFLINRDKLTIIWASYDGQQYGTYWGYTVYKVSGDSLLPDQAPQKIVTPPSFEKCTAVRHVNGRDWWVMFQRANGNYIQALFNEAGMLFMRDIVTQNQSNCCGVYSSMGQASFSRSGKLFATAQCSGPLHYFKFNRNSGVLSEQQTIYLNPQPYGVNFFNDSVLVYLAQRENPNRCVIATINLFNQIVDTLFDASGLHYSTLTLAPDGKSILLPKLFTKNIYKITQSDIDTTFYTDLPYVVRGNPPNLPNYELGPDLHPGFTTSLPDTMLCVGQTFTVTDTSWGHFRRKWEWGDGLFTDTLPVKQHWELLGLVDTFRVLNHTFSQPGTYNLTLHVINDSSEFGYFDSTVSKTFTVLPWCQTPVIQAYTDTVCLGLPFTLSASGDSANYTWTFINGTSSGKQISHVFTQSGWNIFSLKVSKLGVDTTLIDSVFVQDCIRANLRTESIAFCDSVVIKVYPEVIQGQEDSVWAGFQNEIKLCPDSCTFTWLSTSAGSMPTPIEIHLQNSTYDTTFSKMLNLKYLYCPEFLEIYPNPVTEQLNIHFRLEKPEQLRICNAIGQDVLHFELSGNGLYSVDVSTLSRGFYNLRMIRHPDEKRGLKESWKLILE